MTREQLLERKTVLENQIKMFEERIIQEKDKAKEKIMFVRLNALQNSLDRVIKKLAE